MTKHSGDHGVLFFIILLLLSLMGAAAGAAEWRMEVENMADGVENGTLNHMWCGVGVDQQGDLDYGPVQGADTSAPDASYWHLQQPKDTYLSTLRMPALSYGCRLQVRSFKSTPVLTQWQFHLLLPRYDQDGGDVKCDVSLHVAGDTMPPRCEVFNADGYAMGTFLMDPVTPPPAAPAPSPTQTQAAAAPASTPSSTAAPAPVSTPSSTTAPAPMPNPAAPENSHAAFSVAAEAAPGTVSSSAPGPSVQQAPLTTSAPPSQPMTSAAGPSLLTGRKFLNP